MTTVGCVGVVSRRVRRAMRAVGYGLYTKATRCDRGRSRAVSLSPASAGHGGLVRWALVAAVAGAVASLAARPARAGTVAGGPAGRAPAQETGAPSATAAPPTPTLVVPGGTWRLLHGPSRDPLWAGSPPALRGVHGTATDDGWIGWAVGEAGAMARFDGAGWTAVTTFEPRQTAPRTYTFEDVFVAAADDVWVVGRMAGDRNCEGCGVIAHFDGQAWRVLDKSEFGVNSRVAPINAIDMLRRPDGSLTGWAVGDDADFDNYKAIILRYAGGRWRLWVGPNNIARHLYDVKIMSPVEAWAVGQGGSESWYMEDDKGVGSWPRLGHSGVDTLYAVDLADPLFGWDGGDGGRMNQYQGQCHDDTSATQCWFDNAAHPVRDPQGGLVIVDVYGIDLLSRTEGWLVGAANSRSATVAYLRGRLWQGVRVEDDPGQTLFDLYMVDSRRGYAVGASGVVLAYVDDALPAPSPTDTAAPVATASPTTEPPPTLAATESPTPEPTPGPTDLPPPTDTPAVPPTGTPTDVPTPDPSPEASPTPTTGPRWRLFLPAARRGR